MWHGHAFRRPSIRVQGGDFSPSGRLYLSTDPTVQHLIDDGAIKVVEMNGHLTGLTPVDCTAPPVTHADVVQNIYLLFTTGSEQEIEGITVFDTDDDSLYSGSGRGQLHTILLNNDISTPDNYWFKHVTVQTPRKS